MLGLDELLEIRDVATSSSPRNLVLGTIAVRHESFFCLGRLSGDNNYSD